jgi:hypothetical protein
MMNRTRSVIRAQFLPAEILKIRRPIKANVKNRTKFVNAADAWVMRYEYSITVLTRPTAKDAQRRFTAVPTGCGLCAGD